MIKFFYSYCESNLNILFIIIIYYVKIIKIAANTHTCWNNYLINLFEVFSIYIIFINFVLYKFNRT